MSKPGVITRIGRTLSVEWPTILACGIIGGMIGAGRELYLEWKATKDQVDEGVESDEVSNNSVDDKSSGADRKRTHGNDSDRLSSELGLEKPSLDEVTMFVDRVAYDKIARDSGYISEPEPEEPSVQEPEPHEMEVLNIPGHKRLGEGIFKEIDMSEYNREKEYFDAFDLEWDYGTQSITMLSKDSENVYISDSLQEVLEEMDVNEPFHEVWLHGEMESPNGDDVEQYFHVTWTEGTYDAICEGRVKTSA